MSFIIKLCDKKAANDIVKKIEDQFSNEMVKIDTSTFIVLTKNKNDRIRTANLIISAMDLNYPKVKYFVVAINLATFRGALSREQVNKIKNYQSEDN